jgi:signal transduction histidine kinase
MKRDIQAADDDEVTNADLQRLVTELRAAVRARDEFISIAAHELRNPMTPILMQVEGLRALAQRENGPERVAAGLERLERLILAYMRRATTLLDVSRITAGKLRLAPVSVDLSALVRRVALTLAPAAEQAGSRLDLDIADGVRGVWDPLAVEQVLENLLSNAIKFGAAKPVAIALAAEASGGAGACLVVRDRGPGIAVEDRARLFERFEQTVSGREHGGFGIGLWLVGQLLAAMGGAVAVDSRPEEGTAFIVRLPRSDRDANGGADMTR